MKINKKMAFIGFIIGAVILIVWTKSWTFGMFLIPIVLLIGWFISAANKTAKELGKKKRKWFVINVKQEKGIQSLIENGCVLIVMSCLKELLKLLASLGGENEQAWINRRVWILPGNNLFHHGRIFYLDFINSNSYVFYLWISSCIICWEEDQGKCKSEIGKFINKGSFKKR